nr:hypothetical protein [uncultured Lichenicoccus sp.]
MTRIAAILLLCLAACDPNVVMRGYVDVPEPGGAVQKVRLVCRQLYDPRSDTFSLSGITLPFGAVVKAQVGGVSFSDSTQAISDRIRGLDLQQLAICEALILLPSQPDLEQTLKDYVGIDGYLSQEIATLSSSTSASQYQGSITLLSGTPATVAATTVTAVEGAAAQAPGLPAGEALPLQSFSGVPIDIFAQPPRLSAPALDQRASVASNS